MTSDASTQAMGSRPRAGGLRLGDAPGWVYVPADMAPDHPLYGVYGWALLLLLTLFFGPAVLVWQDLSILLNTYQAPPELWIVVATDMILAGFCWIAGARLSGESPSFQGHFFVAVLLAICSTLIFSAVMLSGLPVLQPDLVFGGLALRLVPLVAGVLYVVQSARVNVTTKKRVRADDPWLIREWLRPADAPPPPHRPGALGALFSRMDASPAGRETTQATPPPATTTPGKAPAADTTPAAGIVRIGRRRTIPSALAEVSREAPPSRPPSRPPAAPRSAETAGVERVEPRLAADAPTPPRQAPAGAGKPPHHPTANAAAEGQRADPDVGSDQLDRLRRLKQAHAEGLISTAEFEAKRAALIASL